MKAMLLTVLSIAFFGPAGDGQVPRPSGARLPVFRPGKLPPLPGPVIQQPPAAVFRAPVPIQNRPLQQQAQPGEVLILEGFRMTRPSTGPKTLKEFAETEIQTLKEVCRLTDKQTRVLRIAAKGVSHRIKQAASAAAEKKKAIARPPGVRIIRLNRGFVVPPADRTAEFRQQLHGHRLWTRTLERVLSAEQQKLWQATLKVAHPATVR